MDPHFFLSYTRSNNDAYLQQFCKDLQEALGDRLGQPPKSVGFFDQKDIELGEDWDHAIVEALTVCKVLVPVLSPAFFKSEYCGREVALFRRRLAEGRGGGPFPPLVKPIIWVPFELDDLPPALAAGQVTFGNPGAIQNTEGFKYILKQKQAYEKEYNDLIRDLALEIREAAETHPLPRLSAAPPLREVVSAFEPVGLQAGVGGVSPKSPLGPKHVRLVYVAADPQRFGNARRKEPYLDSGGPDWKPFFPADKTRVHRFMQQVVGSDDLDFTSDEMQFGADLVDRVEEAWRNRQIVVLVVDGWSLHWDQTSRDILERLDQRLDCHWCVLVPWNDQDEDSVAREPQILQALNRSFDRHANLMGNRMFYRDRIKSADELRKSLREVLTWLKEEVRKRAPVDMPVPAGPAKSTITAA